ncbi:MAG: dephospho-CoA kinase [Proteobacteria bacterium]|nr:dephospho-CoA kinase [Pseudomonadota bacterium]
MVKTINKTLKIGVTGGAGSGKTCVCNRIKELGLNIISADDLAKKAVAPGAEAYKNIVGYFGQKILNSDGTLNRLKLRRIIIKDETARSALECFIHPQITMLMEQEIVQAEQRGERFVLIEVPLLFELGIQDRFDRVVLVSAPHELRVQRLMERDGVSRIEAKALLDVQLPDAQKIEQADYVIKNNGSREQLKKNIDLFYEDLIKNIKK